MKNSVLLILSLLALLSTAAPCFGKGPICRYVDANGVTHVCSPPVPSVPAIFIKMADGTQRRFSPAPQSYEGIIKAAGRAYRVDAALIKAVIRAESNFRPGAVSHKGARGLMQIMPANNAALDISNPFDPVQNIMGGTRHLKQLLVRYHKNTALALAAYNAGTSAVDKHCSIPPYPETRAYVSRVMEFYRQYKGS